MRRRLVLAVFLSLGIGACGGGEDRAPFTPQAPPTPTPLASPQPVDGLTGAPVVEATLSSAAPARGERLTVSAPGYLVREEPFTSPTIFLWPGDQNYIGQIVYTTPDGPERTGMVRWAATGFAVTLAPEVADDADTIEAFEAAAAEASRVSGLDIRLGPAGPVVVRVDPDAFLNRPNTCSFMTYRFQRYAIVGAEIVYPNLDTAGGSRRCGTQIAVHEMGHVLGLRHVDDAEAVMNPGPRRGRFSEREEQAVVMMYRHRKPGNQFPDRDPSLFGLSPHPSRLTIID